MISIIVPTLNEERRIGTTLECLLSLRGNKEIIVADGGSDDRTVEYACASGVTVMLCERGRGSQMHAAALASRGEELWFLHADTVPEGNALEHIRQALRDPAVVGGNFSLVFEGDGFAARQMTWIYPRLRLLGLCFGDAGLFVRRSAYEAIGGFQPFPLFEDLDLMGRLRRCGRFVHLNARVYTSCRRFTGRKYAGAWAGWFVLQVLFWMGVSPFRLARWYHNKR